MDTQENPLEQENQRQRLILLLWRTLQLILSISEDLLEYETHFVEHFRDFDVKKATKESLQQFGDEFLNFLNSYLRAKQARERAISSFTEIIVDVFDTSCASNDENHQRSDSTCNHQCSCNIPNNNNYQNDSDEFWRNYWEAETDTNEDENNNDIDEEDFENQHEDNEEVENIYDD